METHGELTVVSCMVCISTWQCFFSSSGKPIYMPKTSPVQNGTWGKPVKSRISILQEIWGGQETISFPEQKQNFPTDCAKQRIRGENWMFPMFKPEAIGLVFTPHYLGKSLICGCHILAGLPAHRLRHGDTVAWQPPAQFLRNPIIVSGLTAALYHRPQPRVNQLFFLSSATQERI